MAKGDIPKKNSPQWVKNESIIAKTPMLRAARDQAEGFNPNSTSSGAGARGGGASDAYKDGWDRIFGKKDLKDE
jgi:hypothetical protein